MDEALAPNSETNSPPPRLPFRLAVGLVQGFALATLFHLDQNKLWPANLAAYFAPLVIVTVFWPPLLLVSAGLRRATFVIWVLLALAIIVGLAVYGAWRLDNPDKWPSRELLPALAALLFIAQSLITAGDADRRAIAHYPTYFDTAWKLGLQGAMSIAFVALFWAVLHIGAALFLLIKLKFLERLIDNRWFALPATTLAFAYAIELTDVRAGLIRGVRTLALMLQSWILPLMTLLTVAFLVALPFTGVEALWQTWSATTLLLVAAAGLVFLINTAYRDGDGETAAIVRIAASIGAVALVPLVAIASYALMLRIGQHGLTPDRVLAFFCAGVAVCFAMGYAISAVNFGGWLKGIEATNVFAAFLILAVILALFTPLADPARISVNDQVARLASGKIAADALDYDFLRFKAGRYGRDALAKLALHGIGKEPDKVAMFAAEAQKRMAPQSALASKPSTPEDRASHIVAYPNGTTLPQAFLQQDWAKAVPETWKLPNCLMGGPSICDAFLIDIDGDGANEILLYDTQSRVFRLGADGAWTVQGDFPALNCAGVKEAMERGEFTVGPSKFREIAVAGLHLQFTPDARCQVSP